MSSCAASCSTCCRPASSVSATSASLPTATAPRSCRSASNCWAAQRRHLLPRPRCPPTRFTRSGTVRSAAEPCTSSSGSPPPNSCSALHRNLTGALLEPLFPPSASTRASARIEIPCLNSPEVLESSSLPPPPDAPVRTIAVPSHPQGAGPYPPPHFPYTSAPDQTHSKCIALHRGGFLQVAVSEAPRPEIMQPRTAARRGAPDTALRLSVTDPPWIGATGSVGQGAD